ncbi:ABC transporter permease [Falsirhodobacter sp. alg1]|uniref:ABC transporter permease n=1 Tax=Falsirhodobacter sp. alg1 TaxID=1472418 RepID=UPI001EDB0C99|nr:ABC transporter permease [Falsirhodobacter sp. alg1]
MPTRYRIVLPILSLAVLLIATFWMQPRTMSYFGVNLLFNLAVPIALATVAQMMIIMVNDIDLGMGAFVSLVACVTATFLQDTPIVGVSILMALILTYAAMGALIHKLDLPAIVVTLGMSFVWGGMALYILPAPGGTSPEWLRTIMTIKPPYVPMAVVAAGLISGITHFVIMRSSVGTLLRGIGGNGRSVARAGWSVIGLKSLAYGMAGLFAVLAGMALVGLTTAADANIALRYTLLSIAGVILGGGRVYGWQGFPNGGGHRCADADACILLSQLHAFEPGLADRGAGRDPDPRADSTVDFHPAGGTDMRAVIGRISRPWIWSWLAAVIVFLMTVILTEGRGAGELAYAALTFGTFAAIVGLGQMLVITLGPGNVDLSIPAAMALAATVSLKVMNSEANSAMIGLLVALLVGLGIGVANLALIYLLRLPPIIATLAASLVYQSVAIWSNRGLRIKPPAELADFATGRVMGIPNIAVVGLILSILVWVVLERTLWGRWLLATGQNRRAARLAGVPVEAVRAGAYLTVSLLAAVAGYLLASFSGGAALNMGAEYLLFSIAVVVIGGTSIAGGLSNVPGIWGASLFMFLVVSMLNSYGAAAGLRLILTGLIIIGIVIAASTRRTRL